MKYKDITQRDIVYALHDMYEERRLEGLLTEDVQALSSVAAEPWNVSYPPHCS